VTGTPDSPGRVGVSVVDIATGLNAYAGILEALRTRDATGRGTHVEVSLFGAIAEWMAVPLIHYLGTGRAPPRVGLAHPSIAPYGVFDCRDGVQLLLSIQNPREWRAFCAGVLREPELADDPQYADNDARVRHRPALDARVSAAFAALDGTEVAHRLDAAGIAWGRLNDVGEFAEHPHLRCLAVVGEHGAVRVPAPPGGVRGSRREQRIPALGEHTEAVRAEFVG
jgi:itaconate CoA-transferase